MTIVEIALDHVAIDIALRQRARTMGAHVVGDEKLAIDIEYRERQILDLDFQRSAGRHLAGGAEIKTLCCARHRGLGEQSRIGLLIKVKAGRYTRACP